MPGFYEHTPDESWILRVGPECYKWGDPWTWGCLVEDYDQSGRYAHLFFTQKPISREEGRWVMQELYEAGYRWARWERARQSLPQKDKMYTTRWFEIRKWIKRVE